MVRLKLVSAVPLRDHVAAISCGLVRGKPVLDLDYAEDSSAEADANFVLTGTGQLVEVQATAEAHPFEEAVLARMLGLAKAGVLELVGLQKRALGIS
jgi:ribonuclease PH